MKRAWIAMVVALALIAVIPVAAWADTIVGSSGATWRNYTTADINADGKPYWDGNSSDGPGQNIGYYLTNTGAFSSSTAGPGAIPYWGNGNGTADLNFYFDNTSNYSVGTMKLEVAGYAGNNIFGWYDISNPGTLHELFAGDVSTGGAGSTVYFTPTAKYGFYLISNGVEGDTFKTQSLAGSDPAFQHFAVFQQNELNYWLGIEDLRSTGDRDYNDMVVKVTNVSVPEPGTLLLLASGLAGLGGVVWRRQRK
jgi:hypothetical protein